MKHEVSPGVAVAVFGAMVAAFLLIWLFFYGPLKRLPAPPASRPVSGGPAIPPPLSEDKIRHGPVGP